MTTMRDSRPLPHNLEAEQSVLGSVFIRPSVWPSVTSELPMDAFFAPAHREIYDAMVVLEQRGMPLDPIMVGDELKARGALSRLEGGAEYLLRLSEAVPTAENVNAYVEVVRNAANKRRLLQLCAEVASRVYGEIPADEVIESLAKQISHLALRSANDLTRIGDVMDQVLQEIEKRQKTGERGVCTGIENLDRITWGFRDEELVIFGADPGAGKSALAVQTGLRLCLEEQGTCLCANLEMGKGQLAERALCHRAEVNSSMVRRGKVSIDEWKDFYRVNQEFRGLDFFIEDEITSVQEFRAKARAWRARFPRRKALAVFDFLQLARGGQGSNRAQQVGNDARELKEIAKELKIPVIGVSSLNRDSKDASERPPRMKDLKESGDVEYAADFVILIWNKDGTKDGPVTLVMPKTRSGVDCGPHGFVPAFWRGRHYRFSDPEFGTTGPQQEELLQTA